jgi:hypothetical protein
MLSRFREKAGRGAIRLSLLGVAMAALLALGGVSAGNASAAASCEGASITGEGAAAQAAAQQNVWGPGFTSSTCPNGPTVSYSPSSSGAGLEQWSAFGGNTINHAVPFIGTSLAPDFEQMANIGAATFAESGETEEAKVQVVPVAQTAIAFVVRPPAHCTITNIKSKALERALVGKKKLWSDIGTTEGFGCGQPIKRVVPTDISGETYQLKHYLGLVEPEALPCLNAPNDTWDSLQATELNTAWPEACKGHRGLTTVIHSANPVTTVNGTAGSIGFAALSDAETDKTGSTTILSVQNGVNAKGHVAYTSPAVTGAAKANCAATTYVLPEQARINIGNPFNVDWSGVYGSALESASYPLCELNWDLALSSYRTSGFSEAQLNTVRDYLYWYMLEPGQGQADIAAAEQWYAPLPATGNEETDVLEAARFIAAFIG